MKSIIKNVLNNAVTYDIGPIVPSMLGYVPPQNVKGAVSFNPSGAKAIVSQLGWLSFTLGYSTGNQLLVSIVSRRTADVGGGWHDRHPPAPPARRPSSKRSFGDHYDTLQTVGGSPNADPDLFAAAQL